MNRVSLSGNTFVWDINAETGEIVVDATVSVKTKNLSAACLEQIMVCRHCRKPISEIAASSTQFYAGAYVVYFLHKRCARVFSDDQ
jgi:hypothetical protein